MSEGEDESNNVYVEDEDSNVKIPQLDQIIEQINVLFKNNSDAEKVNLVSKLRELADTLETGPNKPETETGPNEPQAEGGRKRRKSKKRKSKKRKSKKRKSKKY